MHPALTAFPYLTLAQALTVLRITTAILFMAHAVVRITHGTIPGFGAFLEARGWPMGVAIVYAITFWEIVAGIALILGRWIRLAAAGMMFIDIMGIFIIHIQLGWFVGEHGTGGVEYSLALLVSLITIAAADRANTRATA